MMTLTDEARVVPVQIGADRELGEFWAEAVLSRLGRCYLNCAEVVMRTWGAGEVGALYCEGWAVVPSLWNIPFEHAWIELPDGRIIDPTWVYEHYDPGTRYLASVKFTREQWRAWLTTPERNARNMIPLTVWHADSRTYHQRVVMLAAHQWVNVEEKPGA